MLKQTITTNNINLHVTTAGDGPPLLLIHGYPQTSYMWRPILHALTKSFTCIMPDLRGYGDSDKPPAGKNTINYSKREMAADLIGVMDALGYEHFQAVGHDRGARVLHRLLLDHPERVTHACMIDIVPTLHMFDHTDQAFAMGYYHWFFLAQKDGLPETMIGTDPGYYLREKLKRWSGPDMKFDEAAIAEYLRCFKDPETIRATCDDYRAAATIDLDHDRASRDQRITCPLLVLWGQLGFIERTYKVLDVWREYANDVTGHAIPSGHFVPEEAPDEVSKALLQLFID